MVTWSIDIQADEFGIYDGRVIAQEHVAEAIRLLLAYVDGKPGPAAQIMSTLVYGAAIILQREIDENKGQQWGVHYDDEVVRGDVDQALKKHVEATRELTTALLEKADTDSEKGKH
jgi:hypothetical protein